MPGWPSFAVVIPMYNEEAGAEACVRAVTRKLEASPARAALVVVDDGSRDGTGAILDRLARTERLLAVARHPANLGYGAALRTGVERAHRDGFDYVLFMDSDLTNSPDDIPAFLARMREGVDVIKATRYSRGGRVCGVPAGRFWISRLGNLLAWLLFRLPVHDCTNGFRAVRTSILIEMKLKENSFPIIMEELYHSKRLARSFAEVPVTLSNRLPEQRPTSFRYRPSVFYRYLKYALAAVGQPFLAAAGFSAGVSPRRAEARRQAESLPH